jgi:thioredoxin-related protein
MFFRSYNAFIIIFLLLAIDAKAECTKEYRFKEFFNYSGYLKAREYLSFKCGEGRVVFYFKDRYCLPCRILEREVFSKEALVSNLNNTVLVSFDTDFSNIERKLARVFRVNYTPRIFIFKSRNPLAVLNESITNYPKYFRSLNAHSLIYQNNGSFKGVSSNKALQIIKSFTE